MIIVNDELRHTRHRLGSQKQSENVSAWMSGKLSEIPRDFGDQISTVHHSSRN